MTGIKISVPPPSNIRLSRKNPTPRSTLYGVSSCALSAKAFFILLPVALLLQAYHTTPSAWAQSTPAQTTSSKTNKQTSNKSKKNRGGSKSVDSEKNKSTKAVSANASGTGSGSSQKEKKADLKDAESFFKQRKYKEALHVYNSYIRQNEKDPRGFSGRSTANHKLFRFRPAVDDLTKAINLDAKNPDYYQRRAQLYIHWGEYERALRDLSAALENGHGEKRQIYLDKAHCYKMINANSSVVDNLSEALAIKEEGSIFLLRGDAFRNQRRYKDAAEDYSRAIDSDPDNYELLLKRAMAYEKIKKVDEAIVDYTRIIEVKPDYYRGYFGRANLLFERGDLTKALEDADAAIREYRSWNPKPLHALRAKIYSKMGNSQLAAKDFAKAGGAGAGAKKKR